MSNDTVYILALLERYERLILLGDKRDPHEQKEYEAKGIELYAMFGDRHTIYRKPTGRMWKIDYQALIELSQTGREKLSAYTRKVN